MAAATEPIVENNVYRGEVYDAAGRFRGGARTTVRSGRLSRNTPHRVPVPGSNRSACLPNAPSREVRAVSMKQITEPDGERPYMYDFGENLTGWCPAATAKRRARHTNPP